MEDNRLLAVHLPAEQYKLKTGNAALSNYPAAAPPTCSAVYPLWYDPCTSIRKEE